VSRPTKTYVRDASAPFAEEQCGTETAKIVSVVSIASIMTAFKLNAIGITLGIGLRLERKWKSAKDKKRRHGIVVFSPNLFPPLPPKPL